MLQKIAFWLSVLTVAFPSAISAQSIELGQGNRNFLGYNQAQVGRFMSGTVASSVGLAAVPLFLKEVIPAEWQAQNPKEMAILTTVGTIVGGVGGFFAGQAAWSKLRPSKALTTKMQSGEMAKAASQFEAAKLPSAAGSVANEFKNTPRSVDSKTGATDVKTSAGDAKPATGGTAAKTTINDDLKNVGQSTSSSASKNWDTVRKSLGTIIARGRSL